MRHVRALGVRNIVWRRHTGSPQFDDGAARIVRELSALGYRFFDLEAARATGTEAPHPIPAEQVRARGRPAAGGSEPLGLRAAALARALARL